MRSFVRIDRSATRSIAALAAKGYAVGPLSLPALDPAVSVDTPQPGERAGEVLLTLSQKLALMRLRGSDVAKAVAEKLMEKARSGPRREDFVALASALLATNKGSFHVLTSLGRFRADRIAIELARSLDLHIVTYDLGSFGIAASAQCTCGWRTHRSRHVGEYLGLLMKDAGMHRDHVAARALNRNPETQDEAK